jgi:hypothetical protein
MDESPAEPNYAAPNFTLRIAPALIARLEAQAASGGWRREDLARIYVEEGLRMDAHPGIVFRSGPGGRRAALAGGPDVWEVARVARDLGADAEEAAPETARLLGLDPGQVAAALAYYGEFPEEIDSRIRRVDDMAARAEAAWRSERSAP